MKERDLYYFAHPYTVKDKNGNNLHVGEEANFNLCNIRCVELLKRGYNIYSPISMTHPIHIRSPEFLANEEYKLWIKLDDLVIEKTDFKGIILAPNWEESTGCKNEKNIFGEKGLEILFYGDILKEQLK